MTRAERPRPDRFPRKDGIKRRLRYVLEKLEYAWLAALLAASILSGCAAAIRRLLN